MVVHCRFRSEKNYFSIPADGEFISLANLKRKVYYSKGLYKDFNLQVYNSQTNEEYRDETMLISRNTSVLLRRVPGPPCMPIVIEKDKPNVIECKAKNGQPEKINLRGSNSSIMRLEPEYDDFRDDKYAIAEMPQLPYKVDENDNVKALVDTHALDLHRTCRKTQEGFDFGVACGKGMNGSMKEGRGFGLELKKPPPGYICHRCRVPGHFIQYCPTNGDPSYDIKQLELPIGISTDLPPEVRCPLCREVMKDAAMIGKCCFTSFCDKCIREQILLKAKCICGTTNVHTNDIITNMSLRAAITRMLQIQGVESAHSSTLTLSNSAKEQQMALAFSSSQNANRGRKRQLERVDEIESDRKMRSIGGGVYYILKSKKHVCLSYLSEFSFIVSVNILLPDFVGIHQTFLNSLLLLSRPGNLWYDPIIRHDMTHEISGFG